MIIAYLIGSVPIFHWSMRIKVRVSFGMILRVASQFNQNLAGSNLSKRTTNEISEHKLKIKKEKVRYVLNISLCVLI